MRGGRANYDQGEGGSEGGREAGIGGEGGLNADVVPDVRESALSSWHTARDRAMTRMIARILEEEECRRGRGRIRAEENLENRSEAAD